MDESTENMKDKGKRQENGAKEQKPEQPKQKDAQQDAKEQVLRLAAEFENYKKRTKKEMDEMDMISKASLIREMLPVVDEFELAVMAASKSEDKNMAKGLEMLYANMMETLKKAGLAEVKSEGISDPYKHDVVMVMESDKKDGTILQVIKKGYEFRGRMLRPASVIVAKAPEKKVGTKDENKNNDKT